MNTKQHIATLHFRKNNGAEEHCKLRAGESIKVGRDDTNDIIIDHVSVSRIHCVFSASNAGVVISDLGSTNGTFVNGERVISLIDLSSKDIIDVGATKCTIEVHSADMINSSTSSARTMTAQLKPVAVTVLVTSLTNYRDLSEAISTHDLAELLTEWTAKVSNIVETKNGQVDKVIENSIVAVWIGRDPKSLAKDAYEAATAIKHQTKLIGENSTALTDCSFAWKGTIVLSSGTGLKGTIGASTEGQGDDFTILGDPTNLAFRLEELVGKLGQDVIIAESTADLLKDEVELQHVIRVNIKGQDDEVGIYTII